MAKNQFEELDHQILEAVKSGKNTFSRIAEAVDMSHCQRACRQVDRRVQALRRAGKLIYTGQAQDKGWKLVPPLGVNA